MNEDLRATSSWPLQQSCLVRALPPGDHQRRPGGKTAGAKWIICMNLLNLIKGVRELPISANNQISSNTITFVIRVCAYPWNDVVCQWQGHHGNPGPYPLHLTRTLCNEVQHGLCVLKQLGWKWSTCHMPFKPRQCQNPDSFLLNVLKNDENPKRLDSSLTWWIMKCPHVLAIETNHETTLHIIFFQPRL